MLISNKNSCEPFVKSMASPFARTDHLGLEEELILALDAVHRKYYTNNKSL